MVVVDIYSSLPDRPQAVPAYGRKMLSIVSYGRKRPIADIANIFEKIEILKVFVLVLTTMYLHTLYIYRLVSTNILQNSYKNI